MPMRLVVLECKKVSKMSLGASKLSQKFSGFFWNLFSFSLSIFYLLEGSKIFFVSSKYFIWIVYAPNYLWKFSWNFRNCLSIFRALKTFSVFTGIVFALKSNFRKLKRKKNISYPSRPSPKDQPISVQPNRWPAKSHLGQRPHLPVRALHGMARGRRPLGVRAAHAKRASPRAYKG
jgi:hypothetical protein